MKLPLKWNKSCFWNEKEVIIFTNEISSITSNINHLIAFNSFMLYSLLISLLLVTLYSSTLWYIHIRIMTFNKTWKIGTRSRWILSAEEKLTMLGGYTGNVQCANDLATNCHQVRTGCKCLRSVQNSIKYKPRLHWFVYYKTT